MRAALQIGLTNPGKPYSLVTESAFIAAVSAVAITASAGGGIAVAENPDSLAFADSEETSEDAIAAAIGGSTRLVPPVVGIPPEASEPYSEPPTTDAEPTIEDTVITEDTVTTEDTVIAAEDPTTTTAAPLNVPTGRDVAAVTGTALPTTLTPGIFESDTRIFVVEERQNFELVGINRVVTVDPGEVILPGSNDAGNRRNFDSPVCSWLLVFDPVTEGLLPGG